MILRALMAGLALTIITAAAPSHRGSCGDVRGRMLLTNGTPSVRLWPLGTHRLLCLAEQQEEAFDRLPATILRVWRNPETALWGDFYVCALTAQHPGAMQMIHVVRARNLTVRARP